MANELDLETGTTTDSQQKSQWDKVHTSLQLRWPELKSDELKALPKDESSIKHYVRQRTQANNSEIDAVLKQHLDRDKQKTSSISQSAKDRAAAARETASNYYHQAESQFLEHPAQGALLTFLGGFALGAIVTSLLMQQPEPEPTTWERYRSRYWR